MRTSTSIAETDKILSATQPFFCRVNRQGDFGFESAVLLKGIGYKKRALQQASTIKLLHSNDVAPFSAVLAALSPTNSRQLVSCRLQYSTSKYVTVDWQLHYGTMSGNIYLTGALQDSSCPAAVHKKILQQLGCGIMVADAAKNIIWVNKSFSRTSGYNSHEVLQRPLAQVLSIFKTSHNDKQHLKKQLGGAKPFVLSAEILKKNGQPFYLQLKIGSLKPIARQSPNYYAVLNDGSREHKKEKNVAAEKRKFHTLFESSHLAKAIFDPDTLQIITVNAAARKQYGYSKPTFKNISIAELFLQNESLTASGIKQLCLGYPHTYRLHHTGKLNTEIQVDASFKEIVYNEKKAVLCSFKDVTKTYQLEQELQQAKLLTEQKVLEAKLLAQEEERIEIGKELHDNINQLLTTVKLYHSIALKEKEDKEAMINKATEILMQAMTEIRNLSHALVRSNLSSTGLMDSITHLINLVQSARGFIIHFTFSPVSEGLMNDQMKLNIYRIIQEQLSNIIKHAQASIVQISISERPGGILLSISDDGVGFEQKGLHDGVGFSNIASRVRLLGGRINIASSRGNGCVLDVFLPLKNTITPQLKTA